MRIRGIDPAQRAQRFERWDARCSLRWPLGRVDEARVRSREAPGLEIEDGSESARRIPRPHRPARHVEVNLDLLDGRRTWGSAARVRRREMDAMMGLKRITIAQYERGLLFRNRSFEAVMEPGVHWIFDPLKWTEIKVYDVAVAEFEHPRIDVLIAEARALLERHLMIVDLSDREVGLVYKNDRLVSVLPPGKRQLYWRGPIAVRVDVKDISRNFALDADTARILSRAGASVANTAIGSVEVPDTSVGLLIADGELREVLKPGLTAFWKFQRNVKVELVDLRLQTMEVAGQEILTRDKVSLRVNLTALWQVLDAVQARTRLVNFVEYVYKELQFALREAVGARTLDELLGDKGAFDREISAIVAGKLEGNGVVVRSVGVKDVILPGEMKVILNQVVEAEKIAQANLIRRREETAATRSLLNTARLMDDNPTLLRLKELETLEKVTEKIDKLTVFGGLEGVLKDVVRIQVPGA
jgi:regulator of protease activity HflC (stomatin/prohibitin superfamily)